MTTPVDMTTPVERMPFVLSPPATPVERHGRVDLHLPAADGPRPAVVLVHGAPFRPASPIRADWLVYRGYGALLAGQGLVAALVSYRVDDLAELPATADDIAGIVEQVRVDPRVDADRVVLWFFSGGGLLSADWLRTAPPWLRGIAATYPLFIPLPGSELDKRFPPIEALDATGELPLVLTRAGQDMPPVLAGIEAFLDRAAQLGRSVRVIEVPDGKHFFDGLNQTDQSREAVLAARDAVVDLLRVD